MKIGGKRKPLVINDVLWRVYLSCRDEDVWEKEDILFTEKRKKDAAHVGHLLVELVQSNQVSLSIESIYIYVRLWKETCSAMKLGSV